MAARIIKKQLKGLATVETAIVFPLLLLITMGAIRYGWLFLKTQQITNAARNGARTAVTPDATPVAVTNKIDNLLIAANINTDNRIITIKLDGTKLSNYSDQDFGDLGQNVSVDVNIPHEDVDLVIVPFVSELEPDGWRLGSRVTMAKEGY